MIDEDSLIQKGGYVVGADEVGRGALAGPIVTCACAINQDFINQWGLQEDDIIIRDSKKMTRLQRTKSSNWLKNAVPVYQISRVDPCAIDLSGIQTANKAALLSALAKVVRKLSPISKRDVTIFVDHMDIGDVMGHEVTPLTKGESQSIAIAAASIIAKVYRDALMSEIAKEFPEYAWERNAGYGTKQHLEAIKKSGATPHHRKSYRLFSSAKIL